MAVDIIPALLVRSMADLEEGLSKLRGVAPWVQVDMVGANYMRGQEAFPLWDAFNFEVDFMLPDPAQEIDSAVALGASRVVVHADAPTAREALERLQQYRVGDFAVEVGVALRSGDAPEALVPYAGLYDYVQVMGIEHEGVQGQPPDKRAVALVAAVRAQNPAFVIQVDGAVAPRVRELAAAGANRLVVGSAIVGAQNPKEVYISLQAQANEEVY